MFGKKKKSPTGKPDVSVQELISTATTLKYIGDFLVSSQISGDECEAHLRAIQMTHAQFRSVNADVENHPDYPAFFEDLKKKRAESEAKRNEAARERAAAQPKMADVTNA